MGHRPQLCPLPDITDRMLSERLQELEQEGIVERTVIPETPVRVEYALTRKGRAQAGAIQAIAEWAERWRSEPAPESRHTPPPAAAAAGRRRRSFPPS